MVTMVPPMTPFSPPIGRASESNTLTQTTAAENFETTTETLYDDDDLTAMSEIDVTEIASIEGRDYYGDYYDSTDANTEPRCGHLHCFVFVYF